MERQQFLLRPVIAICGCLTICIVVAVSAARAGTVRSVFDLPERFLPGHPLPVDATCTETVANSVACSFYHINYAGKEVSLIADVSGRNIADAVYSAHEYTIGDLILVWGLPSGFIHYGSAVQVYWDTRFAYLITCSLQPDSHIELISYSQISSQMPPWRGFTTSKESRCIGGFRNR